MPQFPLIAVEIDTDVNPLPAGTMFDNTFTATYIAGSVYVLNPTIGGQVTGMIRHLSISRGKQSALNRVEAGTATLVLDNRDGRFDVANLSSPYAASLGADPERRVRIRAWYNRVGTGQALANDANGLTGLTNATLTITVPSTPRVTGFSSFVLRSSASGSASGTAIYTTTASYPEILPPWDPTKGWPVTPGETITTVASYSTGGGITRNITATIQWRNAAGSVTSTTVGTARSATSSGWIDDFITATVPATAVYASTSYAWTALGSAENVLVTCLGFWYGTDTHVLASTLAAGRPVNINGTPQTQIALFYGLVDSFVNDFTYNFDATCTMSCTDFFRRLQVFSTQDLYAMEVLSGVEGGSYLTANGYWRLNEAAGSLFASDASGNAGPVQVTDPTGIVFGITPSTLTSSSNRSASLGGTLNYAALQGTQQSTLMNFNTTVAFWCIFNSGVMKSFNYIIVTATPGGNGYPATMVVVEDTGSTLGTLKVYNYSSIGTFSWTQTLSGGNVIADGGWHHIAIVFPPTTSGTFFGYVDGKLVAQSQTWDTPYSTLTPWSVATGTTNIGGTTPPLLSGSMIGQLDEVSVINRSLVGSDIATLYQSRTGTFSSTPTRSGDWISRLLNMIAWKMGYQQSDSGDFSLTAMDDLQGSNILDVINSKVMATELGAFFIRSDGQACFYSRSYITTNSQLSVVFSDVNDANYGVTRVPYVAVQRVRDEQLTYNNVALTRYKGGMAESLSVANSQRNGIQTLSSTTYDTDDGTLTNKAAWLLNHYLFPRTRFPRMAVNVASYPAVAGIVISAELMDWAMVVQNPSGTSTLQFTPTIIRVEHSIGPDTWDASFVMDTVDSVVETISASIAYAQLDNTVTAVLGTAQLA